MNKDNAELSQIKTKVIVIANSEYDINELKDYGIDSEIQTNPEIDAIELVPFLEHTNLVSLDDPPMILKNRDKDSFDRNWFRFSDDIESIA